MSIQAQRSPQPLPFLTALLYTLAGGNIAIGDLLDKPHVWVMQHDMEMLDPMDRLQRLPVPEPDDLAQQLASSET